MGNAASIGRRNNHSNNKQRQQRRSMAEVAVAVDLPPRVTKEEAQAAIGEQGDGWDESVWDALTKDHRGRAWRNDVLLIVEAARGEARLLPTKRSKRSKPSTASSMAAAMPGGKVDEAIRGGDELLAAASMVARRAVVGDRPEVAAKAGGSGGGAGSVHKRVPLTIRGGSMQTTSSTAALLKDIGGSARLRAMASRFYSRAFHDKVIDKFVENRKDPHGERLGNWIAEKMGGEGPVWSATRPPNARTLAHRRAWHSHKREPAKRGRRFKLDDCRVWMRLMFWAARDEGLAEHKAFWEWYVAFIRHFIRVYEVTAPPYTQESAEWSAHQENIDAYVKAGRIMTDVVGVHVFPGLYHR